MIKTIVVFLMCVFTSLSATAATITASHDYVYSGVVTDNVKINLDFGVSGRLISDVMLDLTFSGNLWDSRDSIEISYRIEDIAADGSVGWLQRSTTYFNQTANSLNGFNYEQAFVLQQSSIPPEYFVAGIPSFKSLFIDDNGLADFIISSSFSGDGVSISAISVTAELVAVPLPGAFLLFISGLGLLLPSLVGGRIK